MEEENKRMCKCWGRERNPSSLLPQMLTLTHTPSCLSVLAEIFLSISDKGPTWLNFLELGRNERDGSLDLGLCRIS